MTTRQTRSESDPSSATLKSPSFRKRLGCCGRDWRIGVIKKDNCAHRKRWNLLDWMKDERHGSENNGAAGLRGQMGFDQPLMRLTIAEEWVGTPLDTSMPTG